MLETLNLFPLFFGVCRSYHNDNFLGYQVGLTIFYHLHSIFPQFLALFHADLEDAAADEDENCCDGDDDDGFEDEDSSFGGVEKIIDLNYDVYYCYRHNRTVTPL